jgi:RHS repeat-associated protein
MVLGTVELGSGGTAKNGAGGVLCYSKGNGSGDCRSIPNNNMVGGVDRNHLVLTLGDFDGDGVYDVLRPVSDTWSNDNVTGGYQLCHIGTSTAQSSEDVPLFQRCEPWSGPDFYTFSQQTMFNRADADVGVSGTRSMFYGDFDGDGKQDIVTYFGNGQWQVYSAASQAKPDQALDRLVSVTDGVGKVDRVEYALASNAAVYQRSVVRPDEQNAMGKLSYPARPLVKALHLDNGLAGTRDISYRYFREALDTHGRGSLGFAAVESSDQQRGVVTTHWPCLAFPVIGADCGSSNATSAGVVLSTTTQQWKTRLVPQSNGLQTSFPYVAVATVTQRDPLDNDLGTTTTTSAEPDAWGNVLDIEVRSTNPANKTGWSVHKTMTYDNFDTSWLLSQLRSMTDTRSNSYNTIARQTSFTYDAKGLLATQTLEGDATQKLVTTYDRSTADYGLVGKTLVKWTDGVEKTRKVNQVAYTPNGRFMSGMTNALGHTEQYAYDPRTGMKASVTSANNLTTTTVYDGFGRVLSVEAPDGTVTTVSYRNCDSRCPTGAALVTIQDTRRAGQVQVAVPYLQFADTSGRTVRSQTWGFDGRKVVTDTVYDALGRVYAEHRPRYISDSAALDALPAAPVAGAVLQSLTTYDELDRPLTQQAPDNTGTLQTTTHTWSGDTHLTKNPKLQQISEVRDVWGQLATTLDANGKSTRFESDAFGNLARTTDSAGNAVTVSYDSWGRRIQLADPDLGKASYDVNALGQVWRQRSAKQQASGVATLMIYDDLGRMTSRTAEDGTSKITATWQYDVLAGQSDCASYHSCGQLVQATTLTLGGTPDYIRRHSFDTLGRPDTVTTYLDVAYSHQIGYDAWGRVVSESYQRGGDTPKVYGRGYNAYGRMMRIQRNGEALWTATAADAEGRITTATLGNGMALVDTYNRYTGRLEDGVASVAGAPRLHQAYQFDILGNVSQRVQEWGLQNGSKPSFIENFDYDQLNRLGNATIVGYPTQKFTYDDLGNIKTKTGVGTAGAGSYAYDGGRPHAVSAIAGLGTYLYDDNGNMTSGPNRTVTWNAFNMPLRITTPAVFTNFYYGAENQRSKQVDSLGVTTWYAGGMEVRISPTETTVKTYLPLGLGVETDKDGVTRVYYTHRDRLGSVIALSDTDGNVVEALAYDSWGKRRALTTTATPDNLAGVLDNKGYTDHEMLDDVELVHMNGRLYDPYIARVISADPYVINSSSSQSYNRYTYVWNNPTNLTDPSGFVPNGDEGSAGESKSFWDRIVSWFDGSGGTTQPSSSASTTKDQTGGLPKEPAATPAAASVTVVGSLAEANFLQWLDRTVLNEWQQRSVRAESPRVNVKPGTSYSEREMGRFAKLTISQLKYMPPSWLVRIGVVAVGIAQNTNDEGAKNDEALSGDTESGDKKGDRAGSGFPDRELPRDPNGNPVRDPEAEGAHTQLGQKEGRRGKYDQGREWGADGKPVKDIDFTDHGRPQNHTNPHEHPYLPNPTGGTPQHGPARPLQN